MRRFDEGFRDRIASVAVGCVMLVWGFHLAYPTSLLQNARGTFFGYSVPIYYFFIVGALAGSAALALVFERHWTAWEVLWWGLPAICLPGIAHSVDPVWSLRQWLSWVVRGPLPGGVLFLTARRRRPERALVYWIYPIVVAASLLGLREVFTQRNPFWDSYVEHDFKATVAPTSQPTNPFYRPSEHMGSYMVPRGTQENRIPFASILVGFLPLGFWLLRHGTRFYAARLAALGALASILVLCEVRSAWLGALAAALLMSAAGLQRRREAVVTAACAALGLGVFLALPTTRDQLWTRFHSFHASQTSIQERLGVLRTAAILKDHWPLGVGFGQFAVAGRSYYPSTLAWQGTPDDQYLRWAIENGVPSLLLLAVFLTGLVRAGWRKVESMTDRREADFYKTVLVGWAGVAVTFFFFDGFYWGACDMTFWSLLGLFAACLRSPRSAAP